MNTVHSKLFILIVLTLSLAGCATAPHAQSMAIYQPIGGVGGAYYQVKSGDTLWSIAKLYNVDVETLVKANSLSDASTITRGQRLFIPGVPVKEKTYNRFVSKDSFAWPVKGTIISYFGAKLDKTRNKGIDIRAGEGREVRASRSGKVVFCDEGLKGFGKTVILDHGDSYQTVYAYNSDILVNVGDIVQQHAVIARVGQGGRAREPSLHFEIRKDGESQNPLHYLLR